MDGWLSWVVLSVIYKVTDMSAVADSVECDRYQVMPSEPRSLISFRRQWEH